MTQTISAGRDTYFDSLKFILILLVVMGHVFDQNMNDSLSLAVNNTFYLFRIPLFIFISGYFCHKDASSAKKTRTILKLAETFLMFQVFRYLIGWVSNGEFPPLWHLLVYPGWTLWYLLSLIWWRLLIYVMPQKLIDNYKFVLCAAFLISLLGGFIPVGAELSFQRTMTYLPFFFLGYYCGHGQIPFTKHWMNKAWAILALLIALTVMFLIDNDIHTVLYGSHPYTIAPNMVERMGYRAIQLVAILILGSSVLNLVKPLPDRFNKMSQNTLFIYVYHSFVISIVYHTLDAIAPTDILVEYSFLKNLAMYVVICSILWVMMKIPFLHFIMNPISNLLSKRS